MNDDQSLHEGQTFQTWQEFREEFEKYTRDTGTAWRIQCCNTATAAFKNRQMKLDPITTPYYYVQYVCIHFGSPTRRGTGQRDRREVLPCHCDARINVSYHKRAGCYKVKKMVTTHSGHMIDPEADRGYASKCRLRYQQQNIVAEKPHGPVCSAAVRDKTVTTKNLQNIEARFKDKIPDIDRLIPVIKELVEEGCKISYALGPGGELECFSLQAQNLEEICSDGTQSSSNTLDSEPLKQTFELTKSNRRGRSSGPVQAPALFEQPKKRKRSHKTK